MVAAPPAAGSVNPCGKGNPPAFEMVIFFEGSAVSAALSTATGAPDPAAAAEPAAAATPSATDKAKKPATGAAPTTPPAAATTGGAK